jgi:hypothetical protein
MKSSGSDVVPVARAGRNYIFIIIISGTEFHISFRKAIDQREMLCTSFSCQTDH